MDKYVMPLFDGDESVIITILSNSFTSAKEKMIRKVVDLYSLELPIDWEDFVDLCKENDIIIGDIENVEFL